MALFCRPCSLVLVRINIGSYITLLGLVVEPFLVFSMIEEVLVRVGTSCIIRVATIVVLLLFNGGLDVPEVVVGNGLEHLHRKRVLHLCVVLSLQIGDVIVRFAGLEHSKFLLNLFGHLFMSHHAVVSLHNVCQYGNSSFISIICIVFRVDSFLTFQSLIHASLLLFCSHHRVHFFSFDHAQE